jgi:hypothetical protein
MTDSANVMGEEQEQAGILDDPLRDAETVISAFGGVRPMASRLGIAATTIQGWKSRKNIPENRRQMVLEAVQADGLKTAVLQINGAMKDDSFDSDTVTKVAAETLPVSDQRLHASKIGSIWPALIVGIIAAAGILTFPNWSPLIHGNPQAEVPRDVIDRLDALERHPKAPELMDRIAAAERVLDGLQRRAVSAPQTNLSPQLRALSIRVDTLTQALEKARSEMRALDDGSAATLSRMQETVTALSQKMDRAVVDVGQSSVRNSSVLVAIGALEVTLGEGLPYAFALASIEQLAKTDDEDYTQSVAVLDAHAATGIPSRSQLVRRLDALIDYRGKPVWAAATDSWSDRILREIDAVISIRQVNKGSGMASELRQARAALTTNDLKGAADVLQKAGGSAGDWARDAKRRVAADQALYRLRLWALKALEAATTEKSTTQ